MFKKQIGPHTGKAEDFKSYDELWNAFKTQLEYIIDVKMRGNLVIERIYSQMMPAPFLSICTDDCIKKGKDYNQAARDTTQATSRVLVSALFPMHSPLSSSTYLTIRSLP